jgi:Predicted transcriptional regulator
MDTFVRYFLILSLLKPYPRRMTASDMQTALGNQGIDPRVLRTIQRDLEKLSAHFPIDGDQKKPRGWCWANNASVLLPGMDLHTALTFRLMQEFMQPVIPKACLAAAARHFTEAGKVLRGDCSGRHLAWLDKVQVISKGQPLLPPVVRLEVLDTVHEALFCNCRFSANYNRRCGPPLNDCTVNPLGLVYVDRTPYLVCTLWEYDEVKQLALHRFDTATLLDQPARQIEGFNLTSYVKEQKEFEYPEGSEKLKLVARFSQNAAHHLEETPLADDQRTKRVDGGEVELCATVQDTAQLRWWLLGFGDQVEVLKPKALRREMAATASGMAKRYHPAS